MINAASVSKAAIIGAILAHKKPWSWKNRMLALFFVNDKRKGRKHRSPRSQRYCHKVIFFRCVVMLFLTMVHCCFFVALIRNVCRNRGFALSQMDRLPDSVFKRMFRVDRGTFDEILAAIEPFLEQKKAEKAINSSGSPVSNRTQLAVTLHWLAGGSYIDLCFAWGVGVSTFYSERGIIWPTIEAMDMAFEMGLPLHDNEKLEELSQGFFEHSGGIFDGCVLAVDGFAVITRQPYDKEVKYKKDYRYRKGGFAVVVLAGCDIKCRFIVASCNHSGSTNDIIAWQQMELFEAVELDKALHPKYFFIGDEAFTNTNQFLSPWPGKFVVACFYSYCFTCSKPYFLFVLIYLCFR